MEGPVLHMYAMAVARHEHVAPGGWQQPKAVVGMALLTCHGLVCGCRSNAKMGHAADADGHALAAGLWTTIS